MSYRIKLRAPVADEVRRICHEEIDDTLNLLERSRGDADDFAQSVHGARKNLKKLRALLRLIRGGIGDEVRRQENAAFRDAGRMLSSVRDAEVLLRTLASVRKRDREDAPAEAWKQAEALLARERKKRLAELRASDAPFAAGRLLYEARLRLADWPLDGLDWAGLRAGVERIYRQGREGLACASEEATVEAEHDWRKRVKDLWNHLRLLEGAWPDVMESLANEFGGLGDLLGTSHDLAVLQAQFEERLCHEMSARHSQALVAVLKKRRPRFQFAALAIGERLYGDKPRAFVRRIEGYRRTWHEELK